MTTDFERARFNMIEQQVRPWQVLDDRVLGIMGELPRERFVPDAYQGLAYADIEIPIGAAPSQRMLPPKIVGRLLQALALESTDRVYEIGTGTGYLTACLAQLGEAVHSVEIDSTLADQARERLIAEGTPGRIEIRAMDAFGAPFDERHDAAPFAAIAVTGSVPTAEPLIRLREQLIDGGRLFAFVGEAPVMEAVLIQRLGPGQYRQESLFETCVPALENAPQPEAFVF
ncbi:protein-L-isoaspartate O-methyltransferase family protein [Thiorhodovibrio frisius]|uniref:Protein-L-isoaspartate O-methyltransferase n=1 Tax=Thiorhodovibrio frisius TaxID=631362 RepID=H8Z4P4_9GAMM|nr:protein-L-isoaspartate O-methyltransferase [Thiorhodovibrio frisius]EIC20301.1 protein-L-isoaspartate carboxylmethyltransferase [Thiorhodovibrio frisius]WPL21039.1 Protein-L-isoaspartate O-methyltransferase [Thiorhodovibrio frisius]